MCHDTQTTSKCAIQTEWIYLLEQGLCVCVGDCACCLHSLSLKVQTICLGTWKKKSSQCHNRSEPHKRSFQITYSVLWPFLFWMLKKLCNTYRETHCAACLSSVRAPQVTLQNVLFIRLSKCKGKHHWKDRGRKICRDSIEFKCRKALICKSDISKEPRVPQEMDWDKTKWLTSVFVPALHCTFTRFRWITHSRIWNGERKVWLSDSTLNQ